MNVRWQLERTDGHLWGSANAGDHLLMRRFHKPDPKMPQVKELAPVDVFEAGPMR
jgi:hypothetical protein